MGTAASSRDKSVLVLNHHAVQMGAPGHTRDVELFGRLRGWDVTIVAADRLLLGGERYTHRDDIFRTLPTLPYSRAKLTRVLNWASFAVSAVLYGLFTRKRAVVYASSPHLLAGLAGWIVARRHRAPFVLEIRDIWPMILVEMRTLSETSTIYRLLRRLEVFLYRKADVVVVFANGTKSYLETERVDPGRIWLIPNGAEPSDFASQGSRDSIRQQLGIHGLAVLYAGAHGIANGLDQVLDAAGELRETCPEAQFFLIGGGPERAGLQERARTELLTNVTFLPAVAKSEMADVYSAADVGLHVLADVNLFRYGVSPNKVSDYMAAGLPVVTNSPGEVTELVEQAGAGVGVEPGAIAAGVTLMHGMGDAGRAECGRAGRAYVERHRSRTVLARELQKLLDSISKN